MDRSIPLPLVTGGQINEKNQTFHQSARLWRLYKETFVYRGGVMMPSLKTKEFLFRYRTDTAGFSVRFGLVWVSVTAHNSCTLIMFEASAVFFSRRSGRGQHTIRDGGSRRRLPVLLYVRYWLYLVLCVPNYISDILIRTGIAGNFVDSVCKGLCERWSVLVCWYRCASGTYTRERIVGS